MARTFRNVPTQYIFNTAGIPKFQRYLEQKTINGNKLTIGETMAQMNRRMVQGKYSKAANAPSLSNKGYNGCDFRAFGGTKRSFKKKMKKCSSRFRRRFGEVMLSEGIADYVSEQEEKQQKFDELLMLDYFYSNLAENENALWGDKGDGLPGYADCDYDFCYYEDCDRYYDDWGYDWGYDDWGL